MEVHQLNASLNWDSKHEANPWDLSFADVDVAMRCYPTNKLQVPFNFIQADGQRGYSVGIEYTYDILSPKRQFNSHVYNNSVPNGYDKEDTYFDSVNNPRYQQRDLDDVEGEEFSDDIYNTQSHFYRQRGFEFPDDGLYSPIEIHDLEKEEKIDMMKLWQQILHTLDVKYVQGIFKAHLQKPFYTNLPGEDINSPANGDISHDSLFRGMRPAKTSQRNETFLSPIFELFPQAIAMNHLSALFGRNKLCTNLGFNTKSQMWSSKVMLQRKFMTAHAPLFITASVTNPHDTPEMITGISAAMRGYSLQFRTHRERSAVSFSRRGMIWTPFSTSMKKTFLTKWRKNYENEGVMNLPPVPKFQSVLPPEMRLHSILYDRNSTTELLLRYFDISRNIIHQISKVFRYFIDIQVATVESTLETLWPLRWDKFKAFFLSRFYEQLYIFSLGCRTKSSLEYSWKRDLTNQRQHVFRLPVEMDWGCDFFRFWLFLDFYMEFSPTKGKNFFSWKYQHSATFAMTIFDVYTLFTYTISLHPLYRKMFEVWRNLKKFVLRNMGFMTIEA